VSVPTQTTNPTPTVVADAKPKAVSIAKPKTYDYPEGSNQALVIRSMQSGHSYLDDISLDTGLSVEVVLEVLMDFELEGVITSGFGNAYTLV
jgi:predicted Rossmann fold nucleotide-binding protein DprA/Smf involved in DNA uptake